MHILACHAYHVCLLMPIKKSGMHFQKKSNLKHDIKSLRNTLIYGLDPNVDVT